MADRYLAVGIESSYGGGASSVSGVRVTSINFRSINRGVLYDETIEDFLPADAVAGGLRITGTIDMNLRHKQARPLFQALMGTVTAEDTDVDGTDDKFTYTLGYPDSLECRVGYTSYDGTQVELKFLGVGIQSARFTFNENQFVRVSYDVFAKDFSNGTFGEPTYTDDTPLVFNTAKLYTDTGGALQEIAEAVSVELRINRNLKEDAYGIGDYRLTGLRPSGVVDISGTLTFTESEWDEFWNAIRGSTSAGGSTTTLGKPTMEITCSDYFYIKAPITVYEDSGFGAEGRDEYQKTINFRVIKDDTEDFKIVSSDLALSLPE